MPYPEIMIRPMREELTRLGIEEARTPEQVDEAIKQTEGTVMVVVNSVCGCAAGKARPGIARAMQHTTRPDRAITVFAGRTSSHRESARLFHRTSPVVASIALLKTANSSTSWSVTDRGQRRAHHRARTRPRLAQHCASTNTAKA